MTNPLISIVVTTKNEEKNIANCLESIKAQSYRNTEIIVVDNNSADKTKEIARRFTPNVFDCGPERSAQRNHGMMERAQGEYVMFIDADMTLSQDLIKTCVDFISSGSYIALHIREIVLGDNFWSQVRRFERSFYDGTVIDGARFFQKDIFIKIGGFDEALNGPEDWDLDKKIKQVGMIGLVPIGNDQAVIYHNEAEFDLKKYLRKKSYYSKSFEKYINKWGKNDSDIKKQFSFAYRYFGVFVEKGKWRKILAHPVLAIGMYFLRGMVGVIYLVNKKGIC